MMRCIVLGAALLAVTALPIQAEELRAPLEKQFFDFFNDRCIGGMNAELEASGKNTADGQLANAVQQYCSCTSQAVVSYLSAEEIIAFASDPEKEPASSKVLPYFEKCKGK